MIKRILSIVCVFYFLSLSVFAQTEGQVVETVENKPEKISVTLTIDEAVEMAIKNNFSIKQSKIQLDLLAKQNEYSWNGILPSLSVGAGVTENAPSLNVVQDNVNWSDNSLSYSLSASASVRFTPSLFTVMKAAEIAYENGEISYETAKRTVEMNVRQSFYALLNMKESINSNKITLDAAKRTYETNKTKYNRGQLDQLSLLTSQYNYERYIPIVDSATYNYQNNLDSLKLVLGLNLDDEVILKGSLDDVANIQLSEDILLNNMDEVASIKRIKQSIKSAENSIQAAKYTAWGPSVSLSYNMSGSGAISSNNSFSWRNTLGLNVSIPLDGHLPWSSGALNIEAQETNLKNYEMQLENEKRNLLLTARNSYNAIINAQKQLKTYEANLELMQKTYDMTLIAYNKGSKDLSSLQTAQDNLTNARYSIQTQKYTIINAVLNLENTLGVPFGTLLNNKTVENN